MSNREELLALRTEALGCSACRLCETRENVVFDDGDGYTNYDSPVLIVGEGPGAEEDELAVPFVGRAGMLLDQILRAGGIERGLCYITNVVKCRPPNNREPAFREIDACQRFLLRQIEIIDPEIVVTLGDVATRFFLGWRHDRMRDVRGRFFKHKLGFVIFPMYHPSFLLRKDSRERGSPKWHTWQDVRKLAARIARNATCR
jgi:DNA polymerase